MAQALEQTTLQQLAEQVRYYHRLQEEKKRIEMSLAVVKESIMDSFSYTSMRDFTDQESRIKAWVETRARVYISAREAEALLPVHLYKKLARETISAILTVRKLKDKE